MKLFLFAALFLCVLPGCSTTPQPAPVALSTLDAGFEAQFDPMFLSQQPLRYQDARALLDALEAKHFAPAESSRVAARMKRYLALPPTQRAAAADSTATGVATETAMLRLQALRLVAQFGTPEDIPFVRDLAAHPREHPYFEQQRAEALRDLRSLSRGYPY